MKRFLRAVRDWMGGEASARRPASSPARPALLLERLETRALLSVSVVSAPAQASAVSVEQYLLRPQPDATVQLSHEGSTPARSSPSASWDVAGSTGKPLIVWGDLNGDGRPDAIVSSGGQVQVLLAGADGNFRPSSSTYSNQPVLFLAEGDFTGDGHTDVLTVSQASSHAGLVVRALAGDGQGNFQASLVQMISPSDPPRTLGQLGGNISLTVGDLLGNGQLDLMTAMSTPGNQALAVSVMVGTSTGSFLAPLDLRVSAGAVPATNSNPSAEFSILSGDFTGDGHLDLITIGHVPGNTKVALDVVSGSNHGSSESIVDLPPSAATARKPVEQTTAPTDGSVPPVSPTPAVPVRFEVYPVGTSAQPSSTAQPPTPANPPPALPSEPAPPANPPVVPDSSAPPAEIPATPANQTVLTPTAPATRSAGPTGSQSGSGTTAVPRGIDATAASSATSPDQPTDVTSLPTSTPEAAGLYSPSLAFTLWLRLQGGPIGDATGNATNTDSAARANEQPALVIRVDIANEATRAAPELAIIATITVSGPNSTPANSSAGDLQHGVLLGPVLSQSGPFTNNSVQGQAATSEPPSAASSGSGWLALRGDGARSSASGPVEARPGESPSTAGPSQGPTLSGASLWLPARSVSIDEPTTEVFRGDLHGSDGANTAAVFGGLEEAVRHLGGTEVGAEGAAVEAISHRLAALSAGPTGWLAGIGSSPDEGLFLDARAVSMAVAGTQPGRAFLAPAANAEDQFATLPPLLGTAAYLGSLKAGDPVTTDRIDPVVGLDMQLWIAEATESFTRLVPQVFRQFLGRAASPGEEQGWVQMLLQDRAEEDVLGALLGTAEFYEAAVSRLGSGTPDEAYLRTLHQWLLGRPASEAEVSGWLGALPERGRGGVASELMRSQEYRRLQIDQMIWASLEREGTDAELAALAALPFALQRIREKVAACGRKARALPVGASASEQASA